MKRRDFFLILFIILLAGGVGCVTTLFNTGDGRKLRINVDNQEYGIYDLKEDINISIGDTNECQIKGGIVVMVYGDCPDQVCVHSAPISRNGQTIICMPNRVVLEIIDGEADEQVDIIVK